MSIRLSAVQGLRPDWLATATLAVDTAGRGLVEITAPITRFLDEVEAQDGVVLVFLRHTSASLVIQENAAREVRADLIMALERLAPADAGWRHNSEGPDDMPAHVKAMLTGVCLHVPVSGGALALGTWQGVFVVEHRDAAHRRQVVLQFMGRRRPDR
ncbi:MAG TPA: secondary thiamine-phosphate synthase enzyme YjbQ [Xanthobacteraceae bacterium]|nr:secondary thiamine-phosphate synthase enzyme YjbQ [Xanthobacteraceae bacterium]